MSSQASQYLAMHAKDKVHWQTWNQQTLELAQKLNRPLLLSSGYFACHWCHVMQQENYQNSATGKLINEHFIPVKIDRELNPELDQAMIDFAKQTTGQGGWPQHLLLTPSGLPFSAFIYLPNNDFNLYLKRVIQLWQEQPATITNLASKAIAQNSKPSVNPDSTELTKLDFTHLNQQFFKALYKNSDDLSGGLKSVAKFPRAPLLNNLLQAELDATTEDWLLLTLDLMQSEHLFDHIHGGFYRYTVDPEWQIPHFEKMAYNSALLIQSYLLAAQRFSRPDYLTTAQLTLDYLRKDLFNPKTGLYQSSHSAIDKNGIEGGDYLFSKKQLQQLLNNTEYALVENAWQLNRPAPYEQGWYPKTITSDLWPTIKVKLQSNTHNIPKDTKSVLSWNGLMLQSLVLAAETFKENSAGKTYLQQAQALASNLIQLITQPNPPRALDNQGTPLGSATLEDYAYIYAGLKQYQRLTQDMTFNAQIKQLEKTIVAKFYRQHQWHYEHQALLPTMKNLHFIKDEVLPSVLAEVHCLVEDSIIPYHRQIQQNPLEFSRFSLSQSALNCNQR